MVYGARPDRNHRNHRTEEHGEIKNEPNDELHGRRFERSHRVTPEMSDSNGTRLIKVYDTEGRISTAAAKSSSCRNLSAIAVCSKMPELGSGLLNFAILRRAQGFRVGPEQVGAGDATKFVCNHDRDIRGSHIDGLQRGLSAVRGSDKA